MLPATVNIDGSAVRRIREANKLTQLYVAKVVGVTTDTISRWENNRYPSIKRENVLRLAEALETEVDNILQQPEADLENIVEEPRRRAGWLTPAVLSGLVTLVLVWVLFRHEPAQERVLGDRVLPVFAAPGSVIPVWIDVDPAMSRKGYIIREHFPAGWKLIEAVPPPSSLDNVEGIARWIVKPGETRLKVVYLVKVGNSEKLGSTQDFIGEIVAKNDVQSDPARIGGQAQMTIAPYVWADSNGDQIVDDNEMLLASDAFDETQGVHLDWSSLEKIWDAGGYRWDPKTMSFKPVKPQPQSP